jgi:EAL domain-containing protein (putative c-di-GMP-specific phosphodiesterase class I)
MVETLHERGVRVIAPRIEDARGAAALCLTGVDFIQGNFVQAADSDLAFDFRGQQV